jgi:predicted dehydrogenase
MSERIRVGIVGCGTIARRAHVPAWLAQGRAELVALCDPAVDAARQIVERHQLNCATYRSVDDLLANGKPDVVDICCSTPHHYDLAKQALEAGCHVLLEKPPTRSVIQAEELAALAVRKNLKLGCVLNYRYRDLILQLKQANDAGLLGDIVKIYITHHGPLVFTDAPWLWKEQESKYLLWEFGIHFLDVLVYLLGPHVEVVHVLPTVQPGIGQTTDLEVSIRFAHGALGRLEIVADSTRHSSFFSQIHVYGTAMDAFVRWFPPSLSLVSGQVGPLSIITNEVRSLVQIGKLVCAGKMLKQRNISHYRLIHSYVNWLVDETVFPLTMDGVLPTLRLLSDVEQHIPTYSGMELSNSEVRA